MTHIKFLVGAILAELLNNDNIPKHDFASIPQHILTRYTSSSFQSSTKCKRITRSYDI